MKKLLSTFLLILAFGSSVYAQNGFEGQITFNVKLMGEGADQMAAFMPSAYNYVFKGGDLKFWMEGGMTAAMMGEIVVLGGEGKAYMVKHDEKTAYLMPGSEDDDAGNDQDIEVEKLDSTKKILGYSCRKFKITQKAEGGEDAVQYFWTTPDIRFDRNSSTDQHAGGMFVEGVEGFPLMVISTMDMGGNKMTSVMTVTKIDERSVSADEVSVPGDYEVQDFNPQMFGR